nr:hypothetical protein CFP56_01143 [Quercus suber]
MLPPADPSNTERSDGCVPPEVAEMRRGSPDLNQQNGELMYPSIVSEHVDNDVLMVARAPKIFHLWQTHSRGVLCSA